MVMYESEKESGVSGKFWQNNDPITANSALGDFGTIIALNPTKMVYSGTLNNQLASIALYDVNTNAEIMRFTTGTYNLEEVNLSGHSKVAFRVKESSISPGVYNFTYNLTVLRFYYS